MHAGASAEGIEAAAEVAERVGWTSVWTTDHVLVEHDSEAEYGRIFEAILTLAHVGARHPGLRLGTSVDRRAPAPGRRPGQGVGHPRRAVARPGDRRRRRAAGTGRVREPRRGRPVPARGAYLEEAVQLWRHLWGGATTPFHGRFHEIDDFVFEPLPPQGAGLPIWFGGRAEAALRRAGRLGDAYHSSSTAPAKYAERIPVIREAAAAAGRPMPRLSARVRVLPEDDEGYALRGTVDEIRAGLDEWAAVGVGPHRPVLLVGHPRGDRPRRRVVRPGVCRSPLTARKAAARCIGLAGPSPRGRRGASGRRNDPLGALARLPERCDRSVVLDGDERSPEALTFRLMQADHDDPLAGCDSHDRVVHLHGSHDPTVGDLDGLGREVQDHQPLALLLCHG